MQIIHNEEVREAWLHWNDMSDAACQKLTESNVTESVTRDGKYMITRKVRATRAQCVHTDGAKAPSTWGLRTSALTTLRIIKNT